MREQLVRRENSFQGSGREMMGREGGLGEDSLALRVYKAGESMTPSRDTAIEEE